MVQRGQEGAGLRPQSVGERGVCFSKMVQHIVFFKFKDKTGQDAQKARDMLLSLKVKIDWIRDMRVGLDMTHSNRSFDMALECTFDTYEDLQAYDQHPEHLKVRQFIHAVREGSAAVDYEF